MKRSGKKKVAVKLTETSYKLWFDGACWKNPYGHASAGLVVKKNGKRVHAETKYLGIGNHTSNNVAEYAGAIMALEYLIENKIEFASIFGDSQLVINQMTGKWHVKDFSFKPRLYVPYYLRAKELYAKLPFVKFGWVPREKNSEADEMSTQSLVERGLRDPYTRKSIEPARDDVDSRFEYAIYK